jgi:hypothetical protein
MVEGDEIFCSLEYLRDIFSRHFLPAGLKFQVCVHCFSHTLVNFKVNSLPSYSTEFYSPDVRWKCFTCSHLKSVGILGYPKCDALMFSYCKQIDRDQD